MQAELGNNKGERITICDNSTFDRYIADGWSVLSITNEEGKEDGKSTTDEKRPHEARQKRRRKALLIK